MKVNRENLVSVLESVSPGLASKEQIEQSTSFVFKDGHVHTFNDEIACKRPVELPPDLTGAVPAAKVLEQLGKWLDDELNVKATDKALVFSIKKREAGFRLEPTIALPLDQVELPEEWKKLPEGFSEAVSVVQQCASNDETNFCLVCVHIHPKWVEACDNFQAARWPMKTGLKQAVLVRRASIQYVARMGAEEWAETKGWLHFRSNTGLVMSCRRYLEEYHDLTTAFAGEGKPIKLPKGLAEACDKAAVFSSETSDENNVMVSLSPGKLTIRGEGVSGWYGETRKIEYTGPALAFYAAPKVLADLVKRHTEASIAPGKLMVDAGTYRYVLHLLVPDKAPPQESNGEEEEPEQKRTKRSKDTEDET